MFKSSRWRSEKNKIKVVFKLQFHATQVSLVGVDALVVSVVPTDAGKPTTKLEKTTIKDGNCYWNDPVYETVKFVRDPKTGKIHERIYHFVVENGSSKGDVVGDASIDMSCYALATKSSSVSLTVTGLKSELLLHVSIHRMPTSLDEREPEENESEKQISQDRSLRAKLSIEDIDINTNIEPIEDVQLGKLSNPGSKINGNNRRVSSGSDITLSSTDSNVGIDTLQDIATKDDKHDAKPFFSFKNGVSVSDDSIVHDEVQKSWESSTDDSLESGDNLIEKLKRDIAALSRQAEMSDLELQALRKQIVKESRKGHDFLKEINKLKEENERLKEENVKMKLNPCNSDENMLDLQAIVVELRQELNYEKDLNKNLGIRLEKTQESNNELLLAVHDLDEMLEQKNLEIEKSIAKCSFNDDEQQNALEEIVKGHNETKDLFVLEQKIRDLENNMEIYRREKEEIEVQMEQLALDYEISKQENHEILYKLEQCELHEQLQKQYDCSSSYVTINELENQIESLEIELNHKSERLTDSLKTITELESQVKNLKDELEKRSHEHSDLLITVKELEIQVGNLEDELEKQAQGFESDLEALTLVKIEQEQRAIQAEETLKKMRWQNTNATERLQDEFRKLSIQMTTSFEANEGLAAKALTEANELRLQKILLEEKLRKAFESSQIVREQYKSRLHELSGQVVTMAKQLQELQSESDYKSERIEHDSKLAKETEKTLDQEISTLKSRMGTIETENKELLKQVKESESLITELDHKNSSLIKLEARYEQSKKEKGDLETRIALVKSRAEESLRELRRMTCLMDEKDAKTKEIQSEVENLKTECNVMKRLLSEDEFEKEKLRNQIYQLKIDLKRNEEDSLNNKEVLNLHEKINILEDEIKQKESALEISTSSFMEKEKELRGKIEGLEQSFKALNHSNTMVYEQNPNEMTKEYEKIETNFGSFDRVFGERNLYTSTMRVQETSSEEIESKSMANKAGKLNELLGEMALMKQRNEEMESELKEMQERYSEISLKFAEVEGERQQLVMKLRYLKNNKKTPPPALAVV